MGGHGLLCPPHLRNMKRIFTLVLVLASIAVHAQTTDDPVVMTVNGIPVTRSEFAYSYNKNNTADVIDRKTVDEYVDLYINYRLKVAAALDARLDTMGSLRREYVFYRDKQVLPALVHDNDVEEEALRIYNGQKKRIGEKGLVKPAQILLRVGQKASSKELERQKQKADSIYEALRKGADFADMARRFSDDPGSAANDGELPWISVAQTLKEFEDVAFSLNVGELCQPFLSPAGYHIVLMKDRKHLEPFDSLRNDIMDMIEKRKIRDAIALRNVRSMVEETKGAASEEDLMNRYADSLCAADPDVKWLFKEYHDGLLLYEISNRTIWEKAVKDEKALERYFNSNKKKYKWNEPRFKGVVFFTRDANDVAAVKKCIKKLDFDDWDNAIERCFNNGPTKRVMATKGLFVKGDNPVVDNKVFKLSRDYAVPEGFAGAEVTGKKLKAPKHYTDVRGLVISDYQEQLEREWINDLRQRYKVTVDRDVLLTVNDLVKVSQ